MTSEPKVGSDFYDDDETREAYLRHRHSGMTSPNAVMEEPQLLSVLGELVGFEVLDLGCGDGSTAPLLLGLGATRYVGIDGSAGMVRTAREHHAGPSVEFIHRRIEAPPIERRPFDLVLSRMALHYVADIAPVMNATKALLRPGGQLVFSVAHPVLSCHSRDIDGPRTDWTVDNYFIRGPRHRPWFGQQTTWYHRTIEDYVAAVLDAGMAVEALRECEPDATRMSAHPDELERRRRVPVVLLVSARAI